MKITSIMHPEYAANLIQWEKWRDTYEAGDEFIDDYLEQFSQREDLDDFAIRKAMTYCPAFAKAAINDIKNAIFQRIPTVTREGGPVSWIQACRGQNRGVDLKNSTMNNFIGQEVLPELLVMGKVGVYVDRGVLPSSPTKADVKDHPYLYVYKAEDILSWKFSNAWELDVVLLREWEYLTDEETGLPVKAPVQRFRLLALTNGGVSVRFFNKSGKEDKPEQILKINKIPFIVLQLTDSLMKDVCNYQIALLNLGSSDIAFCLKGNFPFYTEKVDPRSQGSHLKKPGSTANDDNTDTVVDDSIKAGVMHGRTYVSERPAFIAPPVDPLKASMEKQKELKDDIRLLVNLNLSNVRSVAASAESKNMDERGLESGLSYIGMELEYGERRIASIWSLYEGQTTQPTVHYPERYSLKSDGEILKEAESLEDRMMAIPSDTYKREIAKKIAQTMLGSSVSLETLKKIESEIDKAELLTTDPKVIEMMVEQAILSNKTAAVALGAKPNEPELAAKDHADRAARILAAQMDSAAAKTAARGVDDTDPNNKTSAKNEKKDSQNPATDKDGKTRVRGEGK